MSVKDFMRRVVAEAADPYGVRRADAEEIRAAERERIARYLDFVATNRRKTGLLGDEVSANALSEAAEWCREPSIWEEAS